MKCEESYECMQRDLDNDLQASEKRALLQHLSKCPDCSLLYERLQHISGRLEQLPMVEPPFSIVQSIMPELDQIDKQRTASTWTEQAASVVPFTSGKDSVDKARKTRLYRSLGGVAAAGLLLSAVIYGMESKSMHEAALTVTGAFSTEQPTGTKSTTTGTQAKGLPAQNSMGAVQETPPGQPAANAQNNKKPVPEVPSGTSVAKANGPAASAGSAVTGSGPAAAETMPKTQPPSNDRAAAAAGTAGRKAHPSPAGASGSDSQTNSQSTGKDQPQKQDDSSPTNGSADQNSTQPSASDNNGGVTVAEGSVAALDKPGVRPYSIAGFAAPQAVVPDENKAAAYRPPGIPSSNEKFYASESDHQLFIRDSQGEIVFASHVWPETYKADYHWISGTVLEYTLDRGDGKASPDIWLIEMEKNAERPIYNK